MLKSVETEAGFIKKEEIMNETLILFKIVPFWASLLLMGLTISSL